MASLGYSTLAAMADDVGDNLQVRSDTAAKTKIKKVLRRVYDEALVAYDWQDLRRVDTLGLRKTSDTDVVTMEDADNKVPLPWGCSRVLSVQIFDPSYHEVELLDADAYLRKRASWDTATGIPRFATLFGKTAQWQALAAAGALTLKCDVATNNDIATVRVRYRGKDGHLGRVLMEDVSGTFNGSGIALSTHGSAGYPVEAVYVPASWVGVLTIEDGSANNIVTLDQTDSPGTTADGAARMYSRSLLEVWPKPEADYKAAIAWKLVPEALTEDNDVPVIPISTYMVEMATAKMLMEDRKWEVSRTHIAEAERFLHRLFNGEQKIQKVARPARGSVMEMAGVVRARNR